MDQVEHKEAIDNIKLNKRDPPGLLLVKDTLSSEHVKAPSSQISLLKPDELLNKLSRGDFSDPDDMSEEENGGDFVEFQYNQKNSLQIVDHDFNQVAQDYIKSLETEPEDTQPVPKPHVPKFKPKEIDINDDSDSDDDWKEINTQLNCGDIYNLKGEKIDSFIHTQEDVTTENTTKNDEKKKKSKKLNLFNSSKKQEKQEKLKESYKRAHLVNTDNTAQGYTRIDEEMQAKKFGEMDKKIDFLFQKENSNLRKLQNTLSSSTDINEPGSTDEFQQVDDFDSYFKNEGHDENELNPAMQMISTKSMLNDSQKIAYAALIKLIIVQLNTELITIRGSGSTKILKKLAVCQKSFMRWSMNVMNAMYEHLDVNNPDEIKMIETLSCHGIESTDLSKSFTKNIIVENKLGDDETKDLNMINIDKNETTMEIDIKWTLICDLFLILLESSVYDARSRTLLLKFAETIGISNIEIYQFERRITDSLEIDEAFEIMNNTQTWDESDILNEHKSKNRNAKIVKVALATAAGGLVIGLSAGALAPVIGAGLVAGLTTIGITGTGGFLAGAGGTAIITTTGVMSGMRAGKNAMQHRVGSVKTFEFIPLHNNKRVNLIITVSGWMSGTLDDVRLPFSTVDQVMGDLYSLLWEPEMLTSMGQTINILANEILTQSIQQILGATLLMTLMAGLQLPMMLSKLGYLLDNPWNNSLDRAWKSGKVLADTLRRNKLGVRPITLVGFSLGARLIYSCLLDLARTGDYGIVESVYLFGSPIVIHDDEIAMVRSVVSGRFVNGYMKQDWILGYLFRATSGGLRSIAGLSPIDEEKTNIENFDCSEYVKGHMQYREVMPKLLRSVGWEVLEDQFVEIEQPNPEEEERQRKLLSDFEKAQHSKKKKSWYNKLWGKKNKEWWEMYEEGESEKKKKEGDGDGDAGSVDTATSDDTVNVVDAFDIGALKDEIAKIEKEAKKMEKGNSKSNKSKSKSSSVEEETIIPSSQPAKFEPRKIRKRQSLSQLVESKETKMETGNTPGNTPELKPFRISTASDAKISRSPSVNINVFGPASVQPNVSEPNVSDKIDYGEYEVPTEENLQISYDDIEAIEKKILAEQSVNSGYGPVTGIDYGDEDEFPRDESKIEFRFD